ncbi:uncharacterized protein ACJ7VT_015283 [Polymixia lowei]
MQCIQRWVQQCVSLGMLLFALVTCASAQDINCTAVRHATHTTYKLSEYQYSSDKCIYQWEANDTVLAHSSEEDGNTSSTSFTTPGCLKEVCFTVDCTDTQKALQKAYCVADCTAGFTGKAQIIQKVNQTAGTTGEAESIQKGHIAAIVIGCLIFALVLLAIFCRKKIQRAFQQLYDKTTGCSLTPPTTTQDQTTSPGASYTAVEMVDQENQTA